MKKFLKTHVKLCIAVLALALVTVGGTLALMAVSSNSVINSFTAASIDTEIEENLTQGNKQVKIKNYGPSDAYVRARIMVSGVSKEKVNIVTKEPSEAAIEPDCVYLVMQHNGGTTGEWCKEISSENDDYSDDFYYYLGVLAEDDYTEELLSKVIIGSELQNEEFLKQFTVTVYHESVLAINKPATPNGEVNLKMVTDSFKNAVPTTNPAT